MEQIAQLLWQTIGLDPASIGLSSIERAVQQRCVARRINSALDYYHLVRSNADELQALIETVVVPETWFFRDPKAFGAVVDHVRSRVGQEFRFLCIPSSTGEEPYSLAMALLDAGLPPSHFLIDAMDISARVLAFARRGIYGRNSFRGQDLSFRDRYFESTPAGYALAPRVRDCVKFHRGNLIDDVSMSRGRTYDAIFCRNLLIYFDTEMQQRAIRALERLLNADGLFCVGPAEAALVARHEFTQARIPLAFAFRKGKEQPVPAARKAVQPKSTALTLRPTQTRMVKPPEPRRPNPTVAPALIDLSAATRLADEGRLDEVAAICEASIRQCGASAQAFFLLGLVRDAANRPEEAAAYYRKALYLNPRHHDALLHFSLLSARRGDTQAAHALRERARRSHDCAA